MCSGLKCYFYRWSWEWKWRRVSRETQWPIKKLQRRRRFPAFSRFTPHKFYHNAKASVTTSCLFIVAHPWQNAGVSKGKISICVYPKNTSVRLSRAPAVNLTPLFVCFCWKRDYNAEINPPDAQRINHPPCRWIRSCWMIPLLTRAAPWTAQNSRRVSWGKSRDLYTSSFIPFIDTPTFPPPSRIKTCVWYFRRFINFLAFPFIFFYPQIKNAH